MRTRRSSTRFAELEIVEAHQQSFGVVPLRRFDPARRCPRERDRFLGEAATPQTSFQLRLTTNSRCERERLRDAALGRKRNTSVETTNGGAHRHPEQHVDRPILTTSSQETRTPRSSTTP